MSLHFSELLYGDSTIQCECCEGSWSILHFHYQICFNALIHYQKWKFHDRATTSEIILLNVSRKGRQEKNYTLILLICQFQSACSEPNLCYKNILNKVLICWLTCVFMSFFCYHCYVLPHTEKKSTWHMTKTMLITQTMFVLHMLIININVNIGDFYHFFKQLRNVYNQTEKYLEQFFRFTSQDWVRRNRGCETYLVPLISIKITLKMSF